MDSKAKQHSLAQRVRAEVTKRGKASVSELVGALGRYITAARAVARYHKVCKSDGCRVPVEKGEAHAVRQGRMRIMRDTANYLVRDRKLVRVSPGVYSPAVAIKIFDPGKAC